MDSVQRGKHLMTFPNVIYNVNYIQDGRNVITVILDDVMFLRNCIARQYLKYCSTTKPYVLRFVVTLLFLKHFISLVFQLTLIKKRVSNMKVSSKISLLHFLEVNRKTRNNIGNKSWRILDMAWVQHYMSAEGKNKSSLKRDVK